MMAPEVIGAAVTGAVSLLLAVYNFWTARQQHKRVVTLEGMRAELARAEAIERARLDYEYDARRRLYERAEPLLFQLLDLSENALETIARLADPEMWPELWQSEPDPPQRVRPALPVGKYEVVSTVYGLYAPLVVTRSLRRSLTLVDLSIEPRVELQHHLITTLYNSIKDDGELAAIEPRITYTPFAAGWRELRLAEPQRYWWQGLTMGRLETMLDLMSVAGPDGDRDRLISFGEFERLYDDMFRDDDEHRRRTVAAAANAVHRFSPRDRPVFWRLLMVQARLYQALLRSRTPDAAPPRTTPQWLDLLRLDDPARFDVSDQGGPTLTELEAVTDAYLARRLIRTWRSHAHLPTAR